MSFAVSIDLIKAKLCERIDTLVPELFPNATQEGREWTMGDVYGAPGRSLSICRIGHKAGWWRDFGGTAKGDVLDLVAAGACEGDIKAAIPWAVNWLKLGGMSAQERRRQEEKAKRLAADHSMRQRADIAQLRRLAKGHYLSAEPLPGTPAERYLLGRAIDLRRLGRAPGALRFKAMKCPESGQMRPCMLAAVNHGATGELLTVHRHFLEQHPDGRVTKAPMAKAKRAYCEYAGGFVPLWRGRSGKPIAQAPKGEWVACAEGVENGLSVALARPELRVLASVSLANLGNITLPDHIGGVYVIADNDAEPDAQRQLEAALAKLEDRGFPTRVVRAPTLFKDFNDWLQALAAQSSAGAERAHA